MIRVAIAEDHHLVREGIRAILEKAGDIEVVGEATNGLEAVELVAQLVPDVLVMDISMPQWTGVMALEKIQALDMPTHVVILSMHSNEMTVRKLLRSGARGYLLKDSVSEELLLAIRAASRGATYLSPGVAGMLISDAGVVQEEEKPSAALTPRENQLLQLISEGLTNNEIAERLSISVKTTERHRANLMGKLRVNNLVELIRVALKKGLISLDE